MNGRLPEQLIFGLDIGTRSIVGTVGFKQNAESFVVAAQAVRFHETRAMLDGQIHDIGRVAETISEVKHELERKLDRKLSEVCIAAAGRVLKTYTIRTDYELGDEMVVTDEFIRSMELIGVEEAHARLRAGDGNSKDSYYCVGYSVIKYYLGDIPISNLEGHKASRIGADILATFLPEDVIDGLYSATERAGLTVINLTLEPIAAINLAIPEKFRLLNLALVDVGAGTSDICITKEGSVVAYGMIPSAGDHITEAIVQGCLVEFNTAEKIKIDLSNKKKKISYVDIMGLKQSKTAAEIRAMIDKPLKNLAQMIAAKIKELNGGQNVSAVFIVGGGGKNPDFTATLAEYAKLPKERVALRGEEVLTQVHFIEEGIVKDPMLVTPIGICLNYYEQNNNFIFVKVNGEIVKLYDNGRLTVMDAAMGIGFPNEKLFPRRGKSLEFRLNGERRLIRGEAGESSVITVNGRTASITSPVVQNDEILIKESTAGEEAVCTVADLGETKKSICFTVNSKKVTCPRLIMCGNEIVSELYSISDGDEISVLDYYTVSRLLEYMDVNTTGPILVNNIRAVGDDRVFENFFVEFGIDAEESLKLDSQNNMGHDNKVEEKEEGVSLSLTVNGQIVTLTGKNSYIFVDILDAYSFDTSSRHGEEVVMTLDGEKAEFMTPVHEGATVELYWK